MRTMLMAGLALASACAVVKTEKNMALGRAPASADCALPVLRGSTAGYEQGRRQIIEGTTFMTAQDAEKIARAEGCGAGADAVLLTSESYDNPDSASQAVMVLLKKKAAATSLSAAPTTPAAPTN